MLSETCGNAVSILIDTHPKARMPLNLWFPTLGPHLFLDYNSQKSWPAQLVLKASGCFSPRTSCDPRLGTNVLCHSVRQSCDDAAFQMPMDLSFHQSLSSKPLVVMFQLVPHPIKRKSMALWKPLAHSLPFGSGSRGGYEKEEEK